MFVTTGGRTDEAGMRAAREIAIKLGVDFVPRDKKSIQELQSSRQEDCLVAGRNRLELYRINESQPFFFHPNIGMLRIKRLIKGEDDPFIEASGITEGSHVLDCTLGLGADAMVASFAAGVSGRVDGVEENPFLAFLVEKGLSEFRSGNEEIDKAMRKIHIHAENHLDFLKKCGKNEYDVVYFDPMFDENIPESDGIRTLTYFASFHKITDEIIQEARRVARQRVVLKDHFRSERFNQFGFKVIVRKTSKFHYGYIEV
ncbi:class I SAM-dependent methyltransferase [Peribacillus sp. SCS-155]|uniref:class I SAM-dependent methyltransferase n=1 Tax=Peribacillus sedimenti TaxID=3115297 RepID=UPI00390645D3